MKKSSFLKKGGFVFPVILITGFLIVNFVSAYDPRNAHRALTYEAGRFYNLTATIGVPTSGTKTRELLEVGTPKLSDDEIEWLMQGAEEEDTPPRWINHFYNPVTGEGWTADKLGGVDSNVLTWFSKFALSSRDPVSAKNWAKNRLAQADYWRYGGDQTWQKAIELYAAGDKKDALITLGHTLHLLEDLTVPDHSRNDTHAGLMGDKGSSYETYAQNQTTGKIRDLKIAENLLSKGAKLLNLPILDDYFEANAKYSHDNFFSDDTIVDKIKPEIFYKQNIGTNTFIFVKNGMDVYPVAEYPKDKDSIDNYSISDPLIMSAYWERLSKQAVISGAGAINLFFQEVEKYKKLHPNPTPIITQNKIGVISPFGELVKLNKIIVQAITGAQKFVADILPQQGKTEVNIDEIAASADTPPRNDNKDIFPRQSSGDMGNLSALASLQTTLPFAPPQNNSPQPPPTLRGGEEVTPPTNVADTSRATATAERLYVSHVIDGDTVTLNNGKDVRLIGMDTPETGDECADEAKHKITELTLGKYVLLEKDKSEIDKYGRLLRYIYIDGVMVNAELVKEGYAKVMGIPPDTKFYTVFKTYEEEAKFFKRGCLWSEEVGGTGDDEIALLAMTPPRNDTSDKGPYYGGTSWAGNPEQPGQNNQNTTIGLPMSNSETTSTREAVTSTPEINIFINSGASSTSSDSNVFSSSTSTFNTSATSTLETAATSTPSNAATSTPETATSTPRIKILINEIQIAGAVADDEFVELYNASSTAADISGWNLSKKAKSGAKEYDLIASFPASSTIPANSHFLIASEFYDAPADVRYIDPRYPIANDNTIILKNADGYIIDKVGMGDAAEYETAPAPNPPKEQSINRQNFADTDNNFNDFIIAVSTPQGTSSTPAKPPDPPPPPPPSPVVCETPIYDSHKNYEGAVDASKALPFPQITGDTMLSPNQTYYIRASNIPPRVPADSRLIIPEGVVIKFGPWKQGSWNVPPMLLIDGNLEINGTKNNPVIFTTFRDDSRGVPINMSTSTPAPNDWGYVQIDSRKGKTIKIQNAEFLYGGSEAALVVKGDADVDISDSKFKYNHAGFFANLIYYAGNISISNSSFEYNKIFGAKIDDMPNAAAAIVGNTFKCNGFGRGNTAVGSLDIATIEMYSDGGDNMTAANNNFWGGYQLGLNYNNRYGSSAKKIFLNAPNNYWGDPSGPYHKTANPDGKGSGVSDYVNFTPWNTAPTP